MKSLWFAGVGWLGLFGCGDTNDVRHLDAPRAIDAREIDASATTVFTNDFESTLPADVMAGTGLLTPTQGYAPLGPPGNMFGAEFLRSPTGNTVSLTVSLPAHTTISLAFLFAAIDSLDGTGTFPAGDYLRI